MVGKKIEETEEDIRPPDSMRRTPQQERSRRMVDAIVQAAHNILSECGRDGLSTTSLEVVSGVSKASIYQYFPNLDSVVAEVFHYVIRASQLKGYKDFPYEKSMTVLEFTTWLLDWAISVHRSVIKLDSDFYLRYSGFYDMWRELDKNLKPGGDSTEHFIYEQLQRCSDFKSSDKDMMLVHALGRAAQYMVYSMSRDNPEFLDDPEFRDILIRMSYAIFGQDSLTALS